MPPIERWPHNRCTKLISKTAHNEDLNIINNEHNNICHTRASQDITYNNADRLLEHLDEQEHIWKTSGTSHQDNTGHHLPRWHIPRQNFQSMALPLLPDTLPDIHFWTKNLLCSSTLCMWAPTHKMPKFPQLTLTPVILPDYLRMAQIPTAHNTSVQYDVL